MSFVNNRITAFFKPSTKQTVKPKKRSLSGTDSTDTPRKRSRSPQISKETICPLPIRTDSPNAKKIGSPLAAVQKITSAESFVDPSPEPSSESSDLSAITPYDSDAEDTIVLAVPQRSAARSLFPKSSAESAVSQSFTSSTSSSHRVERYGQTIITGSDEDDSDELLDLDQLLGRKTVKPEPVQQLANQTPLTRKALRKPPAPKYVDTSKDDEAKFKKLMEQAKNNLARQEDSREASKLAKELEDQSYSALGPSKKNSEGEQITTEKIMSRVGDLDAEKAERFAQAMQRTELTHTSYRWSFFDGSSRNSKERDSPKSDKTFERTNESNRNPTSLQPCCECDKQGSVLHITKPTVECKECQTNQSNSSSIQTSKAPRAKRKRLRWPEIKDQPGWSVFKDPVQRELAFVGGAFEQFALDGLLPNEIYLWILGESFREPQQHLRETYQALLHNAERFISSDQAITYLRLGLGQLGASDEALESTKPIQKVAADPSTIAYIPATKDLLKAWLQNAGILSSLLTVKDRARLLELLLTLALDSAIPACVSTLVELQTALTQCIDSFGNTGTDDEAIADTLRKVFVKAGDAQSRAQCLAVMPASTKRSYQLQQSFALASFYEDNAIIRPQMQSISLQDIQLHLNTNKQFQMTAKTDYRRVAALLACLDIGIGDGDRPESTDEIAIKSFNTTVDALAETIQVKCAKIQANGASHISRTETKDTLEGMGRRLMYAVRTVPKPRANVFAQSTLDGIFGKQ